MVLFACAKSMLDDVYDKIDAGTITLHELLVMKGKREHVSKLLAANIQAEEKARHVKHGLEQRLNECSLFLKRKEHLGQLCQNIEVPVKGIII